MKKKTPRDFSTGQVSAILYFSQQTIIREFDKGRFSGSYRLPGGNKFRRIPLAGLLAYAENNKIPVNQVVLERIKKKNNISADSFVASESGTEAKQKESIAVLVIDRGGSDSFCDRTKEAFQRNNCVVKTANSIFWAGKFLTESQYDIVLLSETFQGNLADILRSFPKEKLGNILGILIFGVLACDVEKFAQYLQREATQRRQKNEAYPPLIVFYF